VPSPEPSRQAQVTSEHFGSFFWAFSGYFLFGQ
jgi:hypothetical protein